MFGSRITQLRKQKRLTQKEMAEKIGISRSALSLYELEKREPDFDTVKKIAAYLGVSIDYLTGNSNNSEISNREQTSDYFFFFFDIGQSDRLKNLMQQNGISASNLASRIDMPLADIASLLNNEGTNLELVLKIAKFFNVSMDYLLCRSDYESVIAPESDVAELLSYYDELTRMDRRWVMGQMIDLIKQKENISRKKSGSDYDTEDEQMRKASGK